MGSNFANIYLMFGVALGWVLLTLRLSSPSAFRAFLNLLFQERRLVGWHLLMSGSMFLISCFGYRVLTGKFPIGPGGEAVAPNPIRILGAAFLCCIGISIFVWRDGILRKQCPELFEDIDEADHAPSWKVFAIGTCGLIFGCYVINVMFVVATDLYTPSLEQVFGKGVFAALHYFLGALVTSLPELSVAIKNYRRVATADLNDSACICVCIQYEQLGDCSHRLLDCESDDGRRFPASVSRPRGVQAVVPKSFGEYRMSNKECRRQKGTILRHSAFLVRHSIFGNDSCMICRDTHAPG